MKKEKLVRDQIPQLMAEGGKPVDAYVVSGDELLAKLKEKLQEEVEEFLIDEALEELADILEVLHALCRQKNISWDQLDAFRLLKAEKRGTFDAGCVLIFEE